MKKVFITGTIIVIVAVLAFVAGTAVTSALAQRGTGTQGGGFGGGMMGGRGFVANGTDVPGQGYGMMGGRGGYGMMGGRGYGMMGGYADGTYGPMHDYMVPALAQGLGLTTEELQARIDGGETPYDVAVSLGFTADQIQEIFTTAHTQALQAAVDAGVITQEQADWMSTHMQQRWGNGYGPGNCPMLNDGDEN